MNEPSLDKFEPILRPGGLLLINSSLCGRGTSRDDVRAIEVPATELADQIGDGRVANMVILGAIIGATGVVSLGAVSKSLRKVLPERRNGLIPLDERALAKGIEVAAAASGGA